MHIPTKLDKIQIYAKDGSTQRMQRREMTADDRETLVVHIGKANTKYNVQDTKRYAKMEVHRECR